MAIDSYNEHMIQLFSKSEPILEILAIVYNSLANLREEMNRSKINHTMVGYFEEAWKNLGKIC